MTHKYELRVLVGADSWSALMIRLRKLTMDLPAQGAEQHLTGADIDGAVYSVDVARAE